MRTSCSGCGRCRCLLLLYVVPFFLALGKPVTVARLAVGPAGRDRIDRLLGDPVRPGAGPPADHVAGDAGRAVAAVPDALVHRGPARRMDRRAHPNPVGSGGLRLLLRPPAGGSRSPQVPPAALAADHRRRGARRRCAGAGALAGLADRRGVLRGSAPVLGARSAARPDDRRRRPVDPRRPGRLAVRAGADARAVPRREGPRGPGRCPAGCGRSRSRAKAPRRPDCGGRTTRNCASGSVGADVARPRGPR